ncbi:MAG: hypothetical protein U0795_25005 [Pirellulales bacterium]
MPTRSLLIFLVSVLVIEILLVGSLRQFGWYGTGNGLQFAGCLLVTGLPLILAGAVLLRRRCKFGVRSVLVATAMVAVFLAASLLPLTRHRAARQTSRQLLAAGASINNVTNWRDFYEQIDLTPTRRAIPEGVSARQASEVPLWLTSFTSAAESIPLDGAVVSLWLNSDSQCQILADNWERLTSLESVGVNPGVSADGLRLLQDVLPRLKSLDIVQINDIDVPDGWYKSLTNIRMLWVWGESASRGMPFDRDDLNEIVGLSNLEALMVLGYAFNDQDAQQLAESDTIKRVILRGTLVTGAGEAELTKDNRRVYRN